jgi:hypothetical protein
MLLNNQQEMFVYLAFLNVLLFWKLILGIIDQLRQVRAGYMELLDSLWIIKVHLSKYNTTDFHLWINTNLDY